jgi:hypothetical protein
VSGSYYCSLVLLFCSALLFGRIRTLFLYDTLAISGDLCTCWCSVIDTAILLHFLSARILPCEKLRREAAGAVDTMMDSACAAATDELFAEGGAGTVGTDRRVAGADSLGVRIGGEGGLAKIDFAEQGGVRRGDCIERAGDALAGGLMEKRVRGGFRLELLRPALEGRPLGGSATIVVDDGVAEDAVEPGHGGFVLTQVAAGFKSAHVGGLKNVLRNGAIFDAALDKAKELIAKV